jgi:nicotinate-nucleotide adenylyltransferase
MAQPRRVGLFGGAFDPPHVAHVAIARAAFDQLGLDELRIIPTGVAWHKSRLLSPAADRLAMVRLAFAELPGVVIDERELKRAGASYTIDTIEALRQELPGAEFFLLMGADQWAAFTTWRQWQEIAGKAKLCVVERPDQAQRGPLAQLAVHWLRLPAMAISATAIRQRLSHPTSTGDLAGLLPVPVARYISDHRLYAAGSRSDPPHRAITPPMND